MKPDKMELYTVYVIVRHYLYWLIKKYYLLGFTMDKMLPVLERARKGQRI